MGLPAQVLGSVSTPGQPFATACVDRLAGRKGFTPIAARTGPIALRYWISLNAADAILTGLGLWLGAVEANPVLSLFADRLGHPGMLFMKTLFAIAVGGILWERSQFRILYGLNYVMALVVVYNLLVIAYLL